MEVRKSAYGISSLTPSSEIDLIGTVTCMSDSISIACTWVYSTSINAADESGTDDDAARQEQESECGFGHGREEREEVTRGGQHCYLAGPLLGRLIDDEERYWMCACCVCSIVAEELVRCVN